MNNPDMDTLASAFALLHGNPPKSLRYRNGLFAAPDAKATEYRILAGEFMKAQMPHVVNTNRRTKIYRNMLLRALYAQLGIESK